MFKLSSKPALPFLLLTAALLAGCGGGEGDFEVADVAALAASPSDLPQRGPEWLQAPAEQPAANVN